MRPAGTSPPETTLTTAPAPDVRATIAHTWLARHNSDPHPDTPFSTPHQLGTITLHPHQRTAVTRLRAALHQDRGALLADETGLGKTYVALALVAESQHPLVITPASLRPMWRDALARTTLHATIHSMEALSLGRSPAAPTNAAADHFDLVVVDEAHHFRNPRTRRYSALANLTAPPTSRVLLLSATPIHNRHRDLTTIIALFLGRRAETMDDVALARFIVRREHDTLTTPPDHDDPTVPFTTTPTRPTITAPQWLALPDDGATLRALTELPPPVPPSDGGAAAALVTHALVRQWASSAGALRAALDRRLERAAALSAGLELGHYPTYRDLRAWCLGDGAVQLAFPELLVPHSPSPTPEPTRDATRDPTRLLAAVRLHEHAVRTLRDRLARTGRATPDHTAAPDPDAERAQRLRELMARHPGAKIVAFAAYEDTVRALARQLARDTRVCALTARGGHVANGRISRRQTLARFAPVANHAPPAPPAERIDLLLTTDLLSEGVNLQDAEVVVHLDLPWTPARLEQRVGRVARLGSPHARISVYAMQPPASSDALLGLDRRLRAKLAEAARAVGLAGSILPMPLHPAALSQSIQPIPPPTNDTRATLERWLGNGTVYHERSDERGVRPSGPAAGATLPADRVPICAAVRSPRDGYLAACIVDRRPYLVAAFGGPATEDIGTVAAAVAHAEGAGVPLDPARASRARDTLTVWMHGRQAGHLAGLADATLVAAGARRQVLRRIAAIIRRSPREQRPAVAALADEARRALTAPVGAGIERRLIDLANASNDDSSWLRAVAECAQRRRAGDEGRSDGARIVAILVLQRRVAWPSLPSGVSLSGGCPPRPGSPSCSISTAPCSTRSISC